MNESTGRPSPRGARVGFAVAVAGTLLAVAGCGSVGSPPRPDVRFHEGIRVAGHDTPQQAAREGKLFVASDAFCGRRTYHPPAQRRQSALTPDELPNLTPPFGGDARRFAALALETFCP